MFWFWFFVAPALLLSILSLRGERRRAEYVARRLAEPAEKDPPPVTLIVPVKGHDEGLRENLASLASLDFPDYELIVAAQSARDIPAGVLPCRTKVVLAGDGDPGTGEKIRNLQAAIKAARNRSKVLAFADSDGRTPKGWLRALVAPLTEPEVGAATGYRWYVPEPPAFWPLLRSVWNGVIAGTLGPGDNPWAWGGAMAIRKSVFEEARVSDYWKGVVSDDYALSAAVHAAGFKIAFAPGSMVACPDHITAREFLGWARRQMILTRVYNPRLWWPALIAHFLYCGGMAASIIASLRGSRAAEWALVVQLGLGMLKGINRATLAKVELPSYSRWFDRYGWVHTWWVPLATSVWLFALIASGFSNTIVWRDVRYSLSYNSIEGESEMAKGMDRKKETKKPKKKK